MRRAGPTPPQRAQRAGQHRVRADSGHPTPRAAYNAADAYLRPARRRRNLTVLTDAYANGSCSTDLFGLPGWSTGCGRGDAAGHRGPRGDPAPEQSTAPAVDAVGHRRCRSTAGGRRGATPRAGGRRGELARTTPSAVIVHCPKPVVTLYAADSPIQLAKLLPLRRGLLYLQRERGNRLPPQRPSSGRPRSRARPGFGTVLGEGPDPPPPPTGSPLGSSCCNRIATEPSGWPVPILRSRQSISATSRPSRTCTVCWPAYASPNGCWTPALRPYVGAAYGALAGHGSMTPHGDVPPRARPDDVPPGRHLPHGNRRRLGRGP